MAGRIIFGMLYSEFIKQAEHVFFEGMRRGYAFGFKGEMHPRIPGWKRTWHVVGGCWLIVDEWNNEGGRTLISYEPMRAILRLDCCIPVWNMSYTGKYSEEVIPFLKAALANSYSMNEFCGGRGPKSFRSKHSRSNSPTCLLYENNWSGTFEYFESNESITRVALNKIEGRHDCRGSMLM